MDEQEAEGIRRTIARHSEVVEALAARKGQRYCNQVTTFLACAKMMTRLYRPGPLEHRGFCYMLIECMGFETPEQILEFTTDVDIVRKAQELPT